FFDARFEFDVSNSFAAPHVDHGDAAPQLLAPLGDRHAAEGARLANARHSDESQRAVKREAARVSGHFLDGFNVAASRFDVGGIAEAGVQHPEPPAGEAW